MKTQTEEIKSSKKNPNDPYTWEVGDILAGSTHFYGIIPHFYKIIKKTAKMFTVVRLEGKLVSGQYDGRFKEIASDELYNDKEQRVLIREPLKINDVFVSLWDGSPIYGDDTY